MYLFIYWGGCFLLWSFVLQIILYIYILCIYLLGWVFSAVIICIMDFLFICVCVGGGGGGEDPVWLLIIISLNDFDVALMFFVQFKKECITEP